MRKNIKRKAATRKSPVARANKKKTATKRAPVAKKSQVRQGASAGRNTISLTQAQRDFFSKPGINWKSALKSHLDRLIAE